MKNAPHPALELLTDLADKVAAAASESLGADQKRAAMFGNEVANRMADDWGGQQVYIPRNAAGQRQGRNAQIFREFTGDNVPDLAKKYGLTIQAVYRIIKAERALRAGR